MLDVSYTQQYLELVKKITDNFNRIVNAALKLWDAKKIKSNTTTTIQVIQPESQVPLLLSAQQEEGPAQKLQMDLTVPQLLYLFKALKDVGLLKNTNLTEVYKAITNTIRLSSKKDGEEISVKKLANTWSTLDAKTAQFWVDKFIDLHKAAKKDNPNNIK